ncbi:unnamed protein product [Paramecium octaurelia]|uniref:Transmembrane protein n=1 Tax=Paramecium octaurelia TaxID=43137 RepID=A0A8S1SEY4_PAROT|nr:unnamed protein product [Paramecium octaurelia]
MSKIYAQKTQIEPIMNYFFLVIAILDIMMMELKRVNNVIIRVQVVIIKMLIPVFPVQMLIRQIESFIIRHVNAYLDILMMANQYYVKNVKQSVQIVFNNPIYAYHVPKLEKQKIIVNVNRATMKLGYSFAQNQITVPHAILINLEKLIKKQEPVIVKLDLLKLMELANNVTTNVKYALNSQMNVFLALNIDT